MKTDIMVVGGGGREHAVIKALRKSPEVGKIYALPGNGGIAADAECVPIKATDIPALVGFAVSHGWGMRWSHRMTRWCWVRWMHWRRLACPASDRVPTPPSLKAPRRFPSS